ncbi:hypothetical protein ACWIG5_02705 [Streptomyces lydicus]
MAADDLALGLTAAPADARFAPRQYAIRLRVQGLPRRRQGLDGLRFLQRDEGRPGINFIAMAWKGNTPEVQEQHRGRGELNDRAGSSCW